MAGLMWHPLMRPKVYTMAMTEMPKANAMPRVPMDVPVRLAMTALPHPMSTRIMVPMSSAVYFAIGVGVVSSLVIYFASFLLLLSYMS